MSIVTKVITHETEVYVCDFCKHCFDSVDKLEFHVKECHAAAFHADLWEYLVTRDGTGEALLVQVTGAYLDSDTQLMLNARKCGESLNTLLIRPSDIPGTYVRTHVCSADQLQYSLLDVMLRRIGEMTGVRADCSGIRLCGIMYPSLEQGEFRLRTDMSALLRVWGEEVLSGESAEIKSPLTASAESAPLKSAPVSAEPVVRDDNAWQLDYRYLASKEERSSGYADDAQGY